MLIRLFTGPAWATAEAIGDFEFDELPNIGHKLAVVDDGEWKVGVTRDIVHRLVDGNGAADIALLLGSVSSTPFGGEALPVTALDNLGGATARPSANVPQAGPWRR